MNIILAFQLDLLEPNRSEHLSLWPPFHEHFRRTHWQVAVVWPDPLAERMEGIAGPRAAFLC